MENEKLPSINYYTPAELVGMFRNFVEKNKKNGVVWMRGIYVQRPNQNPQWAAFYDELRDTSGTYTLTLKVNRQDREKMKSNSLVILGGLIENPVNNNGNIQMLLNVTRCEIIKDQYLTEQDMKRNEIRIAKTKRGFKKVDSDLEEKLMRDERPKVALVLATTSITMLDFNAGVNAAGVKIDFQEYRQSFGSATGLAQFLRNIDTQGFDAIALVRGGGGGIEALDAVEVLEAVATMKTSFICAIGHVGEELFLKAIADKVAPTPNGLGQYFSEMVERVTAKRNSSRAALVVEVRKQFQKELDESNKKNKELLAQVNKMNEQTKTLNTNITEQKKSFDKIADQNKAFARRVESLQQKNVELEKQLARKNVSSTMAILAALAAAAAAFALGAALL